MIPVWLAALIGGVMWICGCSLGAAYATLTYRRRLKAFQRDVDILVLAQEDLRRALERHK